MIKFSQVHYHFEQHQFHFDFNIDEGRIVAIIGPSGAGKSTLLNMLAGFIKPTEGDIQINNQSVIEQAPHHRPLSILFQNNNLFSHLSAYQNIALGLHPGLKLTEQQKQRLHKMASQVGIDTLLTRLPEQLSGGQQQRIALARCFVQGRPILLLDEPFSALDPSLRASMLAHVKLMAESENVTVLMVTHHISDALSVASDFIFVNQNGSALAVEKIEKLTSEHSDQQLSLFLNAEATF
ncbi:thiamine ABC transporter ATP-binding protein [Psychromonas aquatilis]|uniref:Thiamine ABC transporter ATP-binding protein n=1 Tax=Psychromonas aquatilis TaxID=2005072 RepID=A0ABU9GN03_9GAMM